MTPLEIFIVASSFLVLAVLSVYGSHRYAMAYLYYKHKHEVPVPLARLTTLPRVTIQLPIYNEMYVVERLVEAVCAIRYPQELFEVQVLDDSTDETQSIARAAVERFRRQGLNIHYLHRPDRAGFKAGALQAGLKSAHGELIAVFDADFVPRPDFLERTVHYFSDEKVGMVQVRWEHLNRDHSALTQVQSIYLDGHFVIEHTARNRSGRFFNFNGTAGIWRRTAIESAGGWEHDTLTEDLDLSYRAQLAGWKFVYLVDQVAPAEVPVEINAFKSQQHRWAKGSIQTAKKLLPRIFKANLPWKVKYEAFLHLTNNIAYLLIIPLTLLMPLSMVIRHNRGWYEILLLDVPFFLAATASVSVFFIACQREVGANWKQQVKYLPLIMALGIGLAVNNARAVVEAMVGHKSEFTRTPKHGVDAKNRSWADKKYRSVTDTLGPAMELSLGSWLGLGAYFAVENGVWATLPFLLLFQAGYFYVGLLTLLQGRRPRQARMAEASAA